MILENADIALLRQCVQDALTAHAYYQTGEEPELRALDRKLWAWQQEIASLEAARRDMEANKNES